MKKFFLKFISMTMVMAVCASTLFACSTNAQTVAKDESGNKISVAMYSLMTSLLKGDIAYYITYNYGSYNSTEFWNTITDGETQMTYKEYYSYIVEEKAKTYLAALTLFDELGLSLTKEELTAIDEEMDWYVEYDGDGSKNTLNSILGEYGANYNTLREYKIMNAKIAKLETYLYGSGASKVADNVKQDYLNEHYVAFKQILFPTYDYKYETDKFGDAVYYEVDSDGKIVQGEFEDGTKYNKIAYDTEKGMTVDSNNDGINDVDDNNNTIYYLPDSENLHIAYDTKNGMRVALVDENGYKITEEFSSSKKAEVKAEAEKIVAMIEKGNFDGFEDLLLIYDENYSVENESDRGEMYYLAKDKIYESFMTSGGDLLDGIKDEISKLEIGDYTVYKSDYGYHIVMRYTPASGAFSDNKYTNWFVDENGNYDFNTDIVNDLFMKKLQPYIEKIKINDEYKSKVDISKITPNYNFY